MKTKDYIKNFNLTNPSEDDLQRFLAKFIEEFKERLELTISVRKKSSLDTPFFIFQILVKESQDKWFSISSHKGGGPLPSKLWNKFYAMGIISVREKFYPKEHQEITERRLRRMNKEIVDKETAEKE